MSLYIKLEIGMLTHPSITTLSPAAFTLYVRGLLYAKQHMTDGIVHKSALKVLLIGIKRGQMAINELLNKSLWRPNGEDFTVGYENWARHQVTKEEALRKIEKTRERKKKWLADKNGTRSVKKWNATSETEPESETESETEPETETEYKEEEAPALISAKNFKPQPGDPRPTIQGIPINHPLNKPAYALVKADALELACEWIESHVVGTPGKTIFDHAVKIAEKMRVHGPQIKQTLQDRIRDPTRDCTLAIEFLFDVIDRQKKTAKQKTKEQLHQEIFGTDPCSNQSLPISGKDIADSLASAMKLD